MATDAKKEIARLRAQLAQWDYEYHTLDAPTVSDYEYDMALKQLRALEAEYPEFIVDDSATQRVGGPIDRMFTPVKHVVPMQSLSNIFNEQELLEWLESTKMTHSFVGLEPKYDGLAVELVYEQGELVRGSTRGDGRTGEDVTATVMTIKDIPERISNRATVVVRGEVMVAKGEFLRINEELIAAGEKPYANCRNLAAGTLRQKDPERARERNLIFRPYGLSDITEEGAIVERTGSYRLDYHLLETMGFVVDIPQVAMGADRIMEKYQFYIRERAGLMYEIDGMVIKVDDLEARKRLPGTRKFPGWATAFKFPPDRARTRMRHLDWQVGRTGVITPVARFEPISLAGVTVTNATLHNIDEIRRLGLMHGDDLIVTRAGDVIPKVVEAIPNPTEGLRHVIMPPHKCPVCGGRTERVMDQVAIRCVAGLACDAQRVNRIIHFASRNAMDIKGLGDKLIEMLVQRDVVRSPIDLYQLAADVVASCERMADKSARNIIDAIQASRTNADLGRFIFALGIPGVGESTGQLLAKAYGCIGALAAASKEELMELNDVGPIVANDIVRFFAEPNNAAVVRGLLEFIEFAEPEALKSEALVGLTFVITGKGLDWSRDELEALIESHGGKISGSVSAKTNYLIAGEKAGSKLKKAQKLEIPILDSDGFVALLDSLKPKIH